MWVPDEAREALWDLVRAREAAKRDQLRARHRLGKFLLRQVGARLENDEGLDAGPPTGIQRGATKEGLGGLTPALYAKKLAAARSIVTATLNRSAIEDGGTSVDLKSSICALSK